MIDGICVKFPTVYWNNTICEQFEQANLNKGLDGQSY